MFGSKISMSLYYFVQKHHTGITLKIHSDNSEFQCNIGEGIMTKILRNIKTLQKFTHSMVAILKTMHVIIKVLTKHSMYKNASLLFLHGI
jgi:hypothetical protein